MFQWLYNLIYFLKNILLFKKYYKKDKNFELIQSVRYNNISEVKFLLENGADINTGRGDPLYFARRYDYIDIMKILIEKGANISSYALTETVRRNDNEMTNYLISKGADIHVDNGIILCYATSSKNYDLMEYLIEKGININASRGYPLLHLASIGNLEMVKYLISKGATYRDDALVWSAQNNHKEVVKYLISEGANVRAYKNETLRLFVKRRDMDMVKYLLQEGANINIVYKILKKKNHKKYVKYCSAKIMIFILDFHYKRKLEFSKNKLADCNILKIVFRYC